MWLQNFRFANKALSPVELLVLASIKEDNINAPGIIDRLRKNMQNVWEPERGTIYPVLHRLSSMNLLERTDPRKMVFKRSNHGTEFLNSLPADAFIKQIDATTTYFGTISEQIIDINPQLALIILGNFKDKLISLLKNIEKLEDRAKEEDLEWHDVPIG